MKKDGTDTRAQMADRALNSSAQVSGGQVVTVMITYEKLFKPEDLFDALQTKYGNGKVVTDTETVAHNTFSLRVLA